MEKEKLIEKVEIYDSSNVYKFTPMKYTAHKGKKLLKDKTELAEMIFVLPSFMAKCLVFETLKRLKLINNKQDLIVKWNVNTWLGKESNQLWQVFENNFLWEDETHFNNLRKKITKLTNDMEEQEFKKKLEYLENDLSTFIKA